MSIISSVEKRGPVYVLYADGRLFARVDRASFERAPLSEGDEIDEEAYLSNVASAQMADAYEAALTALDRAAKSEKALRRWLSFRGFADPAIDAAIERLARARLLDDRSNAGRLVESGVSGGLSKNAMKRKLRAKGIQDEDIAAAMDAVTDDDQLAAAKRQAEKLYRKYASLEHRAARAKLSQALARRGFAWDVIDQALSGLFDR